MWDLWCFICIWVKVITREVSALTTQLDPFLYNTSINITWLSHIKKTYSSIFISTPVAYCFFKGNPPALGNFNSQLFVFGFIAVWVFGREYSDRTMKDLLALPTPRWAIVSAKFTIVAVWCALLVMWVYALGLGVGAAVNIPQWSRELAFQAARNFAVISGLWGIFQ